LELCLVVEQKKTPSVIFFDERCHSGSRLAGRQSDVKYLPATLPNHRVIVGNEAQEIHLCGPFSKAS
jgi:hypothetical protein